MKLLLIFLGGGIGSVLRYAVGLALNGRGPLPCGTLAANVLGCLLIGLFGGAAARFHWSEELRVLLSVGLCGGFTTFSSFSSESLAFLRNGQYGAFALYLCASLILGIAAAFAGFALAGR